MSLCNARLCVFRIFLLPLFLLALCPHLSAQPQQGEVARWRAEAARVTIVRDDWGIAHVHGATDADAVFGMVYAQAEDDFNRVETNYLNSLGRLAETEGESAIYSDLRMKLFIDPAVLQAEYKESPPWLQALMNSFADGLNFYLARHPETHPKVIHHFEPWMALSFTEGSIGGDIERVDLDRLRAFYGHGPVQIPTAATAVVEAPLQHEAETEREPGGSNGIAIGPSDSATHHALLLINPHTSFFFRSELQMSSDEGLDAYGAVTWGQFFVYQGFNAHAGWMHTSSGVDAVDRYRETITERDGKLLYRYGSEQRPVTTREITVPYRTATGMASKQFKVFYTQHGPVIGEESGRWETIQLMQRHIAALEQSYTRTKAKSYDAFLKTMYLKANSSNNTIFADSAGNIAYFHGNFIPVRDTRFDFTQPVDGANPATDWHGLMMVDDSPHLLNPASGYLFNVNNWPWAGAGKSSLRKADFPAYVETGTESARGLHAIKLLNERHNFTLDSLLAAAFDSYLPWFQQTIPALVRAWDALPASSPEKAAMAEQIAVLRGWDLRWGADSVATSLGVYWGEQLRARLSTDAKTAHLSIEDYAATKAPGVVLLEALTDASAKLTADFGSWKTPWGTINRFQRLNDAIVPVIGGPNPTFSDDKPSIPVPFTSALWGSLASFGARSYTAPAGTSGSTKKRYGTSGNSFVAVVEFGDHVRARAVTAGGESGDPRSTHFNDEALRYSTGNLREVYFYPAQLVGHTERTYHPGSEGDAAK